MVVVVVVMVEEDEEEEQSPQRSIQIGLGRACELVCVHLLPTTSSTIDVHTTFDFTGFKRNLVNNTSPVSKQHYDCKTLSAHHPAAPPVPPH